MIEVLVVISIFALIMASVFANFRAGEFSSQLGLAADNVSTEIRKVQSMTTAGTKTYVCMVADVMTSVCEDDPGACSGDCIEHVPFGGYGLVINDGSDAITLFADIDESGSYDPEERIRDLPVSITGRVSVESLSTDTGAVNTLEIIFVPPAGRMIFSGPDIFGDPTDATINLIHDVSENTQSILLNNISSRVDVIR